MTGLLLLLLILIACATLAGYVSLEDPSFRWTEAGERPVDGCRCLELRMRSQTWRGIPWDHTISLVEPPEPETPQTALLFVTGEEASVEMQRLGALLALGTGAPVAILHNIPNQPLFEGRFEDELIAYTFVRYLETEDPTWPLLFPMVKSAVRAMDVVQEVGARRGNTAIRDFVVTGASKRGWTTWLTAACDPRVRAIAPMVFDTLNFAEQMPHQLELWGRYSEQIEDYRASGLLEQLGSETGRRLLSMVDPWFYRESLTLPKLLIHGANDRYWATDAVRFYWDDLPGEKYLLEVPNSGHSLGDRLRVGATLTEFFRGTAAGRRLPDLAADEVVERGTVALQLGSSAPVADARLWTARALDLDFRPAVWAESPLRAERDLLTATTALPASGGLALFAEAEFEGVVGSYTLSTPPALFGERMSG